MDRALTVALTLVVLLLVADAQMATPGSEISIGSLQQGSVTPANSSSDTGSAAGTSSSSSNATSSSSSSSSSSSNATSSSSSSSLEQGGAAFAGCLQDSAKPECRLFVYSAGKSSDDLELLCKGMPQLSGCSLFRLCTQGVDPVAIGKMPQSCDRFKLLATICQFDKVAHDAEGCTNFNQLCLKPQSTVAQCNYTRGLKYVVPTAAAEQLSRSMCEHDPSTSGCSRCNWSMDTPQCDLLSVYGGLCCLHPGAAECGVWQRMCDKDPNLYVCRTQLPGGRPGPPGPPAHKISSSDWMADAGVVGAAAAPSPQQWAPSAAAAARLHGLSWAAALLAALLVGVWR